MLQIFWRASSVMLVLAPRSDQQQRLIGLGADTSPNDLAPFLGAGILELGEVIHLGHVSARALQKDDRQRRIARGPPQRLLHRPNPVRGNAAGTGRRMTGEIHHAAEQAAFQVPDAHHADLRIDRPGRAHDLRVAGAWMREREAVLHAEPAVERDLVLMAKTDGELGVGAGGVRSDDGLDDLPFQQLRIAGIGGDGLFRRQMFDQRRSVIIIARLAHADRSRRMRVRSANEHAFGFDAAALLNLRARLGDQLAREEQQINTDQRHALLAIVEHHGADFARVVKAAVVTLPVIARRFHADIRRDVTLSETGFETGLHRSLRCDGGPWSLASGK